MTAVHQSAGGEQQVKQSWTCAPEAIGLCPNCNAQMYAGIVHQCPTTCTNYVMGTYHPSTRYSAGLQESA